MSNKYSDYDDVALYRKFQDMDRIPGSDYRAVQSEIVRRWEAIVEEEHHV